jgi:hypothetical protein
MRPLGISPVIPKICIPQLAIPKERTAKIIAMTKPTRLIANSFDVVTSSLRRASIIDRFI